MANLKQAVAMANLKQTTKKEAPQQRLSAIAIARRVFQLAAQAGHPFQGIKPEEWAKKWLASKEFVRTEIPASRAALPAAPANPNRVLQQMAASADSLEPIVVDVNKREIGRSPGGFVPPVIVVDGKHRHVARTMQGHATIEAWVGVKALAQVALTATVKAPRPTLQPRMSKIESVAVLHAMGGGQAGLGSGSGPTPPPVSTRLAASDPSDVTPHKDPSDRYDQPMGRSLDPSDTSNSYGDASPSNQAPGAGVGNRLPPKKGASRSELQEIMFARLNAGPVKIGKIVTDYKAARKAGYKPKLEAKAPAGWEGTVKKMKDHPEIDNPWALAWFMHNEGYQPGGKKAK